MAVTSPLYPGVHRIAVEVKAARIKAGLAAVP
jgi:hypothetical protein